MGYKHTGPLTEMKPGLQSYGKSVTWKTSKNQLKRTFVYILTPFVNIVNLFERNISKQDTIFRIEIPVEKRYYRF